MTKTAEEEFWAGDFGNEYTQRNRVDWWARMPFWADMMARTRAKNILEVGCNAGWNLWAIRALNTGATTFGIDVNAAAIKEANEAGLWANTGTLADWGNDDGYDLAFTAGVLIHVAPENLQKMMADIVRCSRRWVLAIEYAPEDGQREEPIEYRGHKDKLWRRTYGNLYQEMGLHLRWMHSPTPGFDKCTTYLLEKPQ